MESFTATKIFLLLYLYRNIYLSTPSLNLDNSWFVLHCYTFLILRLLHKSNHIVCVLFRLLFFTDSLYCFSVFSFIDFCFLLLALGLFCCSGSRFLRWELRLVIWDISSFLMYALSVINFPFITALTVTHRFQYVVYVF
jgi:hypothetical protein